MVFYIVQMAPVVLNSPSLRVDDIKLPVDILMAINRHGLYSSLNHIFHMTYFLRIYTCRQKQKLGFFV